MNASITELILKKRDGLELTPEEIYFFIDSVVSATLKEAQTGAMLMAMFLSGLSFQETVSLTRAMAKSGQIFSLNEENVKVSNLVDKHSTGGVGDKVSLILAPTLAALGLKVPMMSGWSLNHTGGTLNKLQTIPGFQVCLNVHQMKESLAAAGCFICSSSDMFAPADSILYKLRDLTGTVDNSGLIASSILSKKVAEGIDTLVVDVKYGRGSFQRTVEEAISLADIMVKIGKELNLNVRIVLSEMNTPLGRCVGNALEVLESVKCLRNEVDGDLVNLVKFLGAVILESKGTVKSLDEGKKLIMKTIEDGSALRSFEKMLRAQGVAQDDASALCDGRFSAVLPKAPWVTELLSPKTGVVTKIDSLHVGRACWLLAGGRHKSNGQMDHPSASSGVLLLKLLGDRIEKNEPWIQVHHSTEVLLPEIQRLIERSLEVDSSGASVKKHLTITLHT
ncbi:hypothetical protein RUM44_005513 [Polyplax serrata]|uniref:Thymidine phosphorylase n=1 Tax=Polyplax serrata TaxID=468196 RepID=A0ABR1AF63_POLSC